MLRARLLERDVVVKVWELGPFARLKSILRGSRAFRHWRGASWLTWRGVRTAHCLALLSGFGAGRDRRVEILVMEALPGKTVLHHLADRDLTVAQEHAVAREIGRLTGALLVAGGANRDHKTSNLIVTRLTPNVEIAIIDAVAIRRGLRARAGQPFRMLANLALEPLGVRLFPRRALAMRVLEGCREAIAPDRRFAYVASLPHALAEGWHRVRMIIREHGDPTPRVNPLAPPHAAQNEKPSGPPLGS